MESRVARPRIDDVARRAGVSKTAVSFAFNQPENLKPATRERILAVASELGYRPSPIARRLAARRTEQLGLVVPQPTHDTFANPFLAELVRGIGDACDEEGFSIVIVPPFHGSIARAVDAALVDGLLLLGLAPNHPDLALARATGIAVVGLDIDHRAGGPLDGLDVITVDDEQGACEAAAHLRSLGHRSFCVVLMAEHPMSSLDERSGISGRRLRGIRRGLGLAEDADTAQDGAVRLHLLSAPVTFEGGQQAFEAIQGIDPKPTAVVATSDVTAIGILRAAIDAGVRVPEELSIVGFDDIPAASWTTPRLTTVHQPIREKGRRAAQRLIAAIRAGAEHQPAIEVLPTQLVVRDSTGPARGGGGEPTSLG
jgi:alanine racemase